MELPNFFRESSTQCVDSCEVVRVFFRLVGNGKAAVNLDRPLDSLTAWDRVRCKCCFTPFALWQLFQREYT